MRPQQKIGAVLAVVVVTLIAAVWLNGTAMTPARHSPAGTPMPPPHPRSTRRRGQADGVLHAAHPLPDQPAGTVLRSEVIEDAPEGASAWRVLYLSRNNAGIRWPSRPSTWNPPLPDHWQPVPAHGLCARHDRRGPGCGMSQDPFTDATRATSIGAR